MWRLNTKISDCCASGIWYRIQFHTCQNKLSKNSICLLRRQSSYAQNISLSGQLFIDIPSLLLSQSSSSSPEPPPIKSPSSCLFAFLFSALAAAKKVLNTATKGQFLKETWRNVKFWWWCRKASFMLHNSLLFQNFKMHISIGNKLGAIKKLPEIGSKC